MVLHKSVKRSLCGLGASAVLMLLTTGCGDYGDGGYYIAGTSRPATTLEVIDRPLQQVPGALVGRIDDVDAFVAIVRDGDTVHAYVSDGTLDRLAIDRRLEGTWLGAGPVILHSGSFQLTLRLAGPDAVAGQLAAGGGRVEFRAEPAPPPFGLYAVSAGSAVETLARYSIVLQGGESRGTVRPRGASCRYELRDALLPDGTPTQAWVQVCG